MQTSAARLLPIFLALSVVRMAGAADLNDAKKVVSVMMPEKIHTALKTLDTLAAQSLKTSDAPGLAIAVVSNDQTIYAKGFGVRKTGQKETVDADTAFQRRPGSRLRDRLLSVHNDDGA